jgi:hypothetical protein
VVRADDLPPLFGVEMAGDLGRPDEIAEQYRQMPPLALGCFASVVVFDGYRCGFML